MRLLGIAALTPNHDVDVTSLVQTALTIPTRLASLEHTVVVCGLAVTLVGIANAVLLVTLITARLRTQREAVQPVLRASEVAATCRCGAPISTRSKTGRCRRCALEARTKQRLEPR